MVDPTPDCYNPYGLDFLEICCLAVLLTAVSSYLVKAPAGHRLNTINSSTKNAKYITKKTTPMTRLAFALTLPPPKPTKYSITDDIQVSTISNSTTRSFLPLPLPPPPPPPPCSARPINPRTQRKQEDITPRSSSNHNAAVYTFALRSKTIYPVPRPGCSKRPSEKAPRMLCWRW